MTLTGITFRFKSGAVVETRTEEVIPPAPPSKGVRWYLNNYFEAGVDGPLVGSNFCALNLYDAPFNGTSGQNTWVRLGGEEIELVRDVNYGAPIGSPIWHRLVTSDSGGRIYNSINGADPDIPGLPLNWPRILIGSKGNGERNEILITGWWVGGSIGHLVVQDTMPAGATMARVGGIPKSSDYGAYRPHLQPWFFAREYCIYNNATIGDTPNGALAMPIFDAGDPGFNVGVSHHAMWTPVRYLHSMVSGNPLPQPHPAIVHRLITVTSPHTFVAHVYDIDLTRVTAFVTPKTGAKTTPRMAIGKYNMDLVINGDGGPWLSGPLTSAGRWMSGGTWINQSAGETSAWFNQAGACRISGSAPINFGPWNVISGPKLMISGGIVRTAPLDDSFIAARSAFGLYDAGHAAVIAIEGVEGTANGATEQDLSELGQSLHLSDLLELDSGGSTGAAQKNGIDYSVEQRAVLNCLCFKGR